MSSYGSTFALLRRNGKFLYISDLVNWREYAYSLFREPLGERVPVTETLRRAGQADIRIKMDRGGRPFPGEIAAPIPLPGRPSSGIKMRLYRAYPRPGRVPPMKVYDAASIRNVAVVGHGGSGKTQLVSALLLDAGMVNRLGKVDDGTTVTDYDEEEISRKHTLSASLAYAEWNKTKINLIDTPGFGNFFSDARAAMHVADGAVLVVDGVSGVEVQTEKAWAVAEELALPRLVAVNRLDRDRASLDRVLESLRQTLGRTIVPIQLPLGEEKNFTGVVDLVSMKAYSFAGDASGKMTEGADSRGPHRRRAGGA